MATSLALTPAPDTTSALGPHPAHVSTALYTVAAVLAGASGTIHLAVVRHHLDDGVVTSGFVMMGVAQLLVAAGLRTGSAARLRRAGLLLNAAIVATWLVSRTVGLVVVPGAEERAVVGVADTIANVFAFSVMASLATIGRARTPLPRFTPSRRAARRAVAMLTVAALSLTVPAVLAPHQHSGHDHPATGEPAPGHGPTPSGDGHDDHTHDHG